MHGKFAFYGKLILISISIYTVITMVVWSNRWMV